MADAVFQPGDTIRNTINGRMASVDMVAGDGYHYVTPCDDKGASRARRGRAMD